jgi:hypothetical protein
MGKGKVHYIEVVFDEKDDGDDEGIGQDNGEPSHPDATEKAPLQDRTKGVTIATLSGVPKYYTFRVRGIVKRHRVTTLIDCGATHNFIDVAFVTRRQILVEYFEGFNVVVEHGYNMACNQRIRSNIGNYTLTDEFYVVYLADTHVVLGV